MTSSRTDNWKLNRSNRAPGWRFISRDAHAIRYLIEMNASGPEYKHVRMHDLRLLTPSFQIGRAHSCDIVVTDRRLSRIHCSVKVGRLYLLVRDLASTNGTFVSGNTVAQSAVLIPSGYLHLGDTLFFPADEHKRPFLTASSPLEFERQLLHFYGNVAKVAEILQRAPSTVYRKIRAWKRSGSKE